MKKRPGMAHFEKPLFSFDKKNESVLFLFADTRM